MIIKIHKFITFLVFLFLASFVLAQSSVDETNLDQTTEYRLAPGDIVSVTVFGEPDISVSSMRVPLSGTYNYPLIGELNLINETLASLAEVIESKLRAGFLSDPKVSVNIVGYRPVIVTGSISNPGTIGYQEGMTLRILSALAQVDINSVDMNDIVVQRDTSTFIPQSLDSNILPGDIVSYNLVDRGDHYYIYGEVTRSGKYEISDALTVEQAIIVAGGYTPFASKRNIRVRRNGSEESIKVKLYEPVEPGDVITVKKRWF